MPLTSRRLVAIDGNEAAASVAHRLSEVIAIYPITPSSTTPAVAARRTPPQVVTAQDVAQFLTAAGAR